MHADNVNLLYIIGFNVQKEEVLLIELVQYSQSIYFSNWCMFFFFLAFWTL